MSLFGITGISHTLAGLGLNRFLPQPKAGRELNFRRVVDGVRSAITGSSETTVKIDPEYEALINKQIEVQQQMQIVSFTSNIEKARHESQMAAIRNIRAS